MWGKKRSPSAGCCCAKKAEAEGGGVPCDMLERAPVHHVPPYIICYNFFDDNFSISTIFFVTPRSRTFGRLDRDHFYSELSGDGDTTDLPDDGLG